MTKPEIKEAVFEALREYDQQRNGDKLYTINQVRKRLKISHATLSKKVKAGLITATPDGLISENSINEYLKNS